MSHDGREGEKRGETVGIERARVVGRCFTGLHAVVAGDVISSC